MTTAAAVSSQEDSKARIFTMTLPENIFVPAYYAYSRLINYKNFYVSPAEGGGYIIIPYIKYEFTIMVYLKN